MVEMCACGRPLHYSDPKMQRIVQSLVDDLGPDVEVTVGEQSWLVPRHYVALHGIRGWELPTLGFPRVQRGRNAN